MRKLITIMVTWMSFFICNEVSLAQESRSATVSYVELPYNKLEDIKSELNGRKFRNAMRKILDYRMPEGKEFDLTRNEGLIGLVRVGVAKLSVNSELGSKIIGLAAMYAGMRAEGHTESYALEAIGRNFDKKTMQANLFLSLLQKTEYYPTILEDHLVPISPDKIPPGIAYRVENPCYVLIDGAIAWVVRAVSSVDGECFVAVDRCDAKEFDPKFTDTLIQARKEIDREFEDPKYEYPGSNRDYWKALKKNLKKKGIDWMTPEELSPTIYD